MTSSQVARKRDIHNLSLEEISVYIAELSDRPFRAGQIIKWLYEEGVHSFDEMRNLPAELRQRLHDDFLFDPVVVSRQVTSADGTIKFLFELTDQQKVETVLIPTSGRVTACISTQAGCKFGCKFCASGVGGWIRNLSCAEILYQVLHVRQEARRQQRRLSHIVFMGTGEPLDNLDNVLKAIRIINAPQGLGIAARHITLSTVGLIPAFGRWRLKGCSLSWRCHCTVMMMLPVIF